MAIGRVLITLPLFYQQLFYVPPPPAPPAEEEPQFVVAPVTISVPRVRTLFYQAKVAPPVQPPPEPAGAETFTVTTGAVNRKAVFYQAHIAPIVVPVVDNTGSFSTWYVPLSRAPTRPPVEPTRFTPFVPGAAPPPTIEWLQPFKRQVAALQPVRTQPVLGYQPEAEVVSNLTTTLEWLQPFQRAAAPPHPVQSQFVLGYQPEEVIVSNLTTTLEWMQAWQGPPRRLLGLAGGQTFVATPTITPSLEWMQAWRGAVPTPQASHTQPVIGYQPEAVVESNLTTTLEWMPSWRGPPRLLQQLTAGVVYPPQGVVEVNIRTEWDWQISWQGPPRYLLKLPSGSPFVPAVQQVEQGWHQPLSRVAARPRVHAGGSPFVPSVQPVAVPYDQWWHQPLSTAVDARPVRHTQPVYGYPYLSEPLAGVPYDQWWHQPLNAPVKARPVNRTQPVIGYQPTAAVVTVPYDQWWHQPLSRAARRPAVHKPYQPFVPRAVAVVTVDQWLQPFGRAKARARIREKVRDTNVYQTTTATVAVPYISVQHTTVPVTRVLYVKNLFEGKVPPVFVEPEPVEMRMAAVTTGAVRRKSLYYQAKIGMEWATPPAVVVEPPEPTEFLSTTVTTAGMRRGKTLFYQAWTFGYPYEGSVFTPPVEQYVTVGITVAFERMLRYSCKVETGDTFSEQEEQSDPWATQAEVTVNFIDETEQADPWSSQEETADTSDEEDQEPQSGCE